MIRLLVDGVFFQLQNTGIARVWRSVLERLLADPSFEIHLLDRGCAPAIPGLRYVPFPKYIAAYCPADSAMIQRVCDHLSIDVFTSTYYTTPLATPMLLMVHDMIPELFGFDLSLRGWSEKSTAISFAQRYLCVSHNTRRDLLEIFPEIPPERASTAHCGVDSGVFRVREQEEIAAFRREHGLERPYFLFVGSRVQHNGYKNSSLFFDALSGMYGSEFDVFCVGGEPRIDKSILESLPSGVRCVRKSLDDMDLALAYGGAIALVYPSLYEGFGMPVIEAMASGCPVITTRHGSLLEAAGDAALLIDGVAVAEMREALHRIQEPALRETLRERGLAHAARFRWEGMTRLLAAELSALCVEARAGTFDGFFREWRRLRTIQSAVDYERRTG